MKRRLLMVGVPVALVAALAVTGIVHQVATAAADSERNVVIERIVQYLKGKNVDMHEDRLKAVVHKVYEESQQYDLDYRLALAVIKVESNFQQDAVSNKGARGLFQIKPSLAKYIAKDAGVTWSGAECLHEPDKNIKLGMYHLSKLIDDFKNVSTALHAYNAGESKLKGKPAGKKESKTAFTKKVLKEYRSNLSVLPDSEELEK